MGRPIVFAKCFLQKHEGLRLGIAGIRGERFLAHLRVGPAGRDRNQFLMQACGPWSVEAEAPQEHNAGNGVRGLGQTGSRHVVVDETLRREAAEESLHDAVFQMQMDDLVVHRAGVLKNDWADRRGASPLPEPLIAFAGRAQGIHRIGPC